MAEKPRATHAIGASGVPRILSGEERREIDDFVLGVLSGENTDLWALIHRVAAADRFDKRDGILFVADIRGPIGAWLLEVLSQGRTSADEYSIAASRARRFAPVVAQFWQQSEADEHLPRIVPGAIEAAGPRRNDQIRVVMVNKRNQVAIAFMEEGEDNA